MQLQKNKYWAIGTYLSWFWSFNFDQNRKKLKNFSEIEQKIDIDFSEGLRSVKKSLMLMIILGRLTQMIDQKEFETSVD